MRKSDIDRLIREVVYGVVDQLVPTIDERIRAMLAAKKSAAENEGTWPPEGPGSVDRTSTGSDGVSSARRLARERLTALRNARKLPPSSTSGVVASKGKR